MTLEAILDMKLQFYDLKSHVRVIVWSLRVIREILIKIEFYLMRGYAQCAALESLRIVESIWSLK